MSRPHVVIVGAGFGGIDCAKELVNEPVQVTIVDRHNFHTFQPLLYQVATAGLASSDVAYPVRGIFQDAANVRFRTGVVTGVDWDAKRIALSDGAEIGFDVLVLAAGATTNWFGVDGAAEHAFPLYSLEDAIRLRNHVISRFERADADPELLHQGTLTFVVLGGGPTGVETAGALMELFGMVFAKDFRRLDVGAARVVLLEMAGTVLAPFSNRGRRQRRRRRSPPPHPPHRVHRVGRVAVPPPAVPRGVSQPAQRARVLGLVVRDVGPRPAPHPRADDVTGCRSERSTNLMTVVSCREGPGGSGS